MAQRFHGKIIIAIETNGLANGTHSCRKKLDYTAAYYPENAVQRNV